MTERKRPTPPPELHAAFEEQRRQLTLRQQVMGVAPEQRTSAADEIETDPDTWRAAVLGRWFQKPDGWFHKRAWAKIWAVEEEVAPRPLLLPWFRFAGKSATIRGGAVALAARRRRRFFLYFSRTQESADRHVTNINRMLLTPEMARYYPDLAQPLLSKVTGAQVSWSRQQIVTRGGVVFVALGLESASRGINWEEIRPDVIIVDDIDGLRDSIQVVNNKIEVLGSDVFPAGQENTWIVFAQNVIHSQSIMYRTLDFTSGILIDHDKIGPVPAFHNFEYDKRTNPETGRPRYYISSGSRPSWPEGYPKELGEKHLNEILPRRYEREFQHNVTILPSGAIYPGYNPVVHIVTQSELARAFAQYGVRLFDERGKFRIPHHYTKAMGHDFGTTVEHPSAVKWVTTPPEFEPFGPTDGKAGLIIWYRERTLPKYPALTDEAQEPVSPMRICKMIRAEEAYAREGDHMRLRVMSHEQTAAQNTYNVDEKEFSEYDGLQFAKVKPDRWGGIPTMQDFFEVDYTKPNQFRRYPKGCVIHGVDMSGQPVPGEVRMIFVVADGQGELYVDESGALKVTSAVDDDGMIRSRAERMQYTEKVAVTGDTRRVPNDFFNDQMDAERNVPAKAIEAGILFVVPALAPESVRNEEAIKRVRPDLSSEAIAARPVGARQGALVARMMVERYLAELQRDTDSSGSALGRLREERSSYPE